MKKETEPSKKFIPFISDYGFKVTFGDKENTAFARRAIEIILGEQSPIRELTHLRNEFQGLTKDARAGLYDVLCQDESKRVFIIEMQSDNYDDLIERLQFYAFQLFTSLVDRGKTGFKKVKPVYCICIIKGRITKSRSYHQVVTLKNEDNEVVMGNIAFHFIELGKFPIARKNVKEAISPKEKLFYTMKYLHLFDTNDQKNFPPFWGEEDFYKLALERLDLARMTPLEIAAYNNFVMRERVFQNHWEKKMKEAEDKGEEKGIEKGMEKGMEEGIKQSIIHLLEAQMPKEQIASIMKVSLERVSEIEKSLKK